ncbi:MAG: lipid biosynthesis B12-binding/radical SAM protein [bacterium]
MKVLLISVNNEDFPSPVYPLGLAYIRSSLKRAGHKVSSIDIYQQSDWQEAIDSNIESFAPEIVGISIRNVDNLTYPSPVFYLPFIKQVVEFIKTGSEARIVVGGSGYSVFPGAILEYLDLHYGIVGEGEIPFFLLLSRWGENRDINDLPGIVIRENGKTTVNRCAEALNWERPRLPDREDLTSHNNRAFRHNLQTKRGCPFKCRYCTYPVINGSRVRVREPDEICEEWSALIDKYDCQYIDLVDDIFNYPAGHAEDVCREIIRRDIRCGWTAFIHPKDVSEELFPLMKKAGCVGVEIGVDSLSDKVLEGLGKSFSFNDVEHVSGLCRKVDLKYAYYLIFGGPDEDEKTLEETFELCRRLNPTAVIALAGIRIYPSTLLAEIASEEGIIDKDDSLLDPKFYFSTYFRERKDMLCKIIAEHACAERNWIVPGLGIRSPRNLFHHLKSLGYQGPLWNLLR